MDEDNNNQQQTDLENNPVSQMEKKITDKTVEQVQDIANNLMAKVKKMVIKALKKFVKLIVKVAMNLLKLLIKIIVATAPVSIIVIVVIIIVLLIIAIVLSMHLGLSNVFKNDVKSGDVSTSEIGSVYDESYVIHSDNNFTIEATNDIVEISEQIHDYIAYNEFWYRNGNTMDYPEILRSHRNDNK